MKSSIIFYSARKTSLCEKALRKCLPELGLNLSSAVFATKRPMLGEALTQAFTDADVVFTVGGLEFEDDRSIRMLMYAEYGEIWFDGHTLSNEAREIRTEFHNRPELSLPEDGYLIEAARYRDHVRIRVFHDKQEMQVIAALPDAARFSYLGLTGEHCRVFDITVEETEETVGPKDIPRLMEEITYINRIEGDIPNTQVDGYREGYTKAIPVSDGMRLAFHTMSLPTATLIWHCPFWALYTSDDGTPSGANYKEFACIRLDGENATWQPKAQNTVDVHKGEDFHGWDEWKAFNKRGYSCEISIYRRRNKIIMTTENNGIFVKATTIITDGTENVYLALTGDQVALTDIRIL